MSLWKANNEYTDLPSSPMSMPQLIWRFFYSRGVKDKDTIDQLFSPTLKDLTHPFKLNGMQVAVERLYKALQAQQKICVYGDFDLDGTSGLALLVEALEMLGFKDVVYYQPKRLSEGYGFHASAVETLAEAGVELIITVDVGITGFQAVEKANEIGVDVILTDHHLPEGTLPRALALINPNTQECDAELGHLAGTGVAFYLALALQMHLKKQGVDVSNFNPKELLDCFCIGTLTDLVPLKNENRVLVKHGLKALRHTKRPGLKALMVALGLADKDLTASDVAIRFAPKLNALSRLESEILPIDIYMEPDFVKAEALVQKVLKINEQRINLQTKGKDIAQNLIRKGEQKGYIFLASKDLHQGIVGLIATQLMQEHNVPAFVAAIKEDDSVVGSSRLPDGDFPSLVDALDFSTEALNQHGGHKQAAGFELKKSNIKKFDKKLSEYYLNYYENHEVTLPVKEYDAEGILGDITPDFMKWMDALEPFGKGFESPVFRFRDIEVKGVRPLRGGHYKFTFQCSKTKTLKQGLWFSPPKSVLERDGLMAVGDHVEILGEPQWNHYNGNSTIQLLVKDIERV